VRYDAAIKRWYQKNCAGSLAVVTIKAVAHKLARACYHVIKDSTPFDAAKAFGSNWNRSEDDQWDDAGSVVGGLVQPAKLITRWRQSRPGR